jgi:hypothetical protein
MASHEYGFWPPEVYAPVDETGGVPVEQVESENSEQSFVGYASEIPPQLDTPSPASAKTTDELPQTVSIIDIDSVTPKEGWNEQSKAERALREATGYVPPLAGGAESRIMNGRNKRHRDLGFYAQVVPRLAFTNILPLGPRPRDFADQESYQEAVGEHMERIWEILDGLSDEQINFLRRWCGPYEDLQEMWQDWEKYTPAEREEAVMKWRKLARRDQ